MALLSLRIPRDVRQILQDFAVPGEKVHPSTYHITVLYFDAEAGVPLVTEALAVVTSIIRACPPLKLRVETVTSFPPGDDGYPVICPVSCKLLHRLRQRLCAALDVADVPYSRKFPDFKPHLTLSYSDQKSDDYHLRPPLEWTGKYAELSAGGAEDMDFRALIALGRDGKLARLVREGYNSLAHHGRT